MKDGGLATRDDIRKQINLINAQKDRNKKLKEKIAKDRDMVS